jgi:LytS/YehU family sensor histidine kinase
MILLPVAENAMKHGPSAGNRGGVSLRVRIDGATLTVEIENPGSFAGPRDGGSGLPMIKKRLALAYDEGAMFDIRGKGERTIATLRVPTRGLA